jgi:guanylate kinase
MQRGAGWLERGADALNAPGQTEPPADTAAETPVTGLLFVLSGPSGVGKSTLIAGLKADGFPITYCVTATTRPCRVGEVEGVHYYFISEEEYDQLLQAGQFLENATVHNLYRYGVPIYSVRDGLRRGHDLIMAPDVQGARVVRAKLPQAITIFLKPASLDELLPRLQARGTESVAERRIRLATAERELLEIPNYDYVVVNYQDRLREALSDLKSIIRAERLRTEPRRVTL